MTFNRRSLIALASTATVAAATSCRAQPQAEPSAPPGGRDDFARVRLTDYLTPEMKADVRAGTLRVDCAPALQAALDAASGKGRSSLQSGRKLVVPAGRYLLAAPVSLVWRDEEKVKDDGDMRRISIEGDGQANTVFFYRGDDTKPAIRVRGFKTGPNDGDGVSLRLTISGLQLVRDLSSRQRGVGLSVNGAALIRLIDMEVSMFDVNIDMIDTLRVYVESVQINGGNVGLRTRGGNFSNPNVYKFLNCSISGNLVTGAHVIGGCNVAFDSCALEGNGRDATRGAAILLEDGPAQGGAAGHIDNCYFENNFVQADVLADWKDTAAGTLKLTACTFQRTAAVRAAQHHVKLQSRTASLLAHVDCCAFKSFGDYKPSADRTAVAIVGNSVRVSWTANLFQHPEEAPRQVD